MIVNIAGIVHKFLMILQGTSFWVTLKSEYAQKSYGLIQSF